MPQVSVQEGYINFHSHRTWYRLVAPNTSITPSRLPLLCLHGGPGVPHDYLEPLEALAAAGHPVIFYDQRGCGNSDGATDPSVYSIEFFKQELGVVRRTLGLGRFHLLGQSWGGCLALEHVLEEPEGICSLILASTPANVRQFVSEAYRLMETLPASVQQVIQAHEATGTTQSEEYQEAMRVFNHHYLCSLDPWPDCLQRAYSKVGKDFRGVGKIIDWQIEDRLGHIQTPTLLVSGRNDEVTPACVQVLHQGIQGAEWVLFEHSSHMPHLEEPDRFLQVLRAFLVKAEEAPVQHSDRR